MVPWDLTLRQLEVMARCKDQAEWARASSLQAMIANITRDPKRRDKPYQPSDFDPYHERPKQDNADEIRKLFKKPKKGKR